MNIILIRHPVTKANISGIVEHNIEGELDKRGYEQIDKLVKRLEYEKIDKIYSSDAHRCKLLAEEIGKLKNISPSYNKLFREINYGVWFGKKKEEIQKLLSKDPKCIRSKNGENLLDLERRATEGFKLIKNEGGKRSILISHGLFLKIFLGYQLSLDPLTSINQFKFSNCAISEIKITESTCLVEYLNNRDYLK